MTSDNTQETLSVQIANQIINIANDRHEDGLPVDEIAAGLRHAAANFSAFAYFRSENKGLDPNAIADEFVNGAATRDDDLGHFRQKVIDQRDDFFRSEL